MHMKFDVLRLVGCGLLLVGAASVAFAQTNGAPEIDPGTATVPLALLGGAAMIIRSRIRRRQ
jgi:hypothetical protein